LLSSPLLPQIGGYVDGRWRTSAAGPPLRIVNPATGETLAEVPSLGARETTDAAEAGAVAMQTPTTLDERRSWLRALSAAMTAHRDELGQIITLEQGKPLAEGVAEVDYAISFFSFFAEQLAALAPRAVPSQARNLEWTVMQRPAGVAGLISPWNFPLAMLAKKLAAAIGAGCAVVAKPSELTPLSAIALWTIIDRLKMPPGLMNLIVGEPAPIGKVLCQHPAIRVVSFTGSTEVGRVLIRESANYVKRLALELGGNAPFVVFEDAEVQLAADALVANKFRAGGQTCVCTNRVYVQSEIAASFVDALAERVGRLKVGDGMQPGTDIGPLINRAGFDKVDRHVRDAIAKGATRIVGHDPEPSKHDWGNFYPATLLTGITPEMELCQEETFGPVVAVSEFRDEDAVVEACNSTIYGLAAYVFTNDAARGERVIARLAFGHVGLNTGSGPAAHAPFGGMKKSGFGREGGLEGLLEFCEPQTIASA
jgi:succinate-semialdehyde dehydrogenase / glutarate-semialdehyde dehydrogenase